MFLRSLTLRGFKSFASRTVLEFGPGVSVIVGPNGSGKSNLVDAIAWVLGEQGPRALRGGQMADVVFAGGHGKQALGMARVSLVIDNGAGLVPVEASEIEVARAVYRSGDSEYSIGGRSCRLLDIQELLSDTGIGRGLHTVIGQGHLEDALQARPEDRRRFIEEAAGIAKHRLRKERAERKLAALEQDLLRLEDVMGELRSRLKPLRRQAEAAEKHDALSAEAASLARRIAAARLRDLRAERERRRPSWEEGLTRRRAAEERLSGLDRDIARLRGTREEAERRLDESERAHAEALRARSAAEAALRLAVRAEGEARARMAAHEASSGRLFTLEEQARRTEAALSETTESLAVKQAELAEAERAFRAADRARRDAEEARLLAGEAAASRRAERDALRRSLDSAEDEGGRLAASLEDLAAREGRARAERGRLEREVERLDAEETPLAQRQSALQRERERVAAELADLEEVARGLEARRQAAEARRAALAQTAGSRFMERARHALGLLSDLIEVERGMERAVAAALGPLADAVVFLDHDRAVAEARDAGGATLLVSGAESARQRIPGERSLLDAVTPDTRVGSLVAGVLGDVYLSRDPEKAMQLHREHPEASFVTPDGLLIGPLVVRSAPTPTEAQVEARRESASLSGELARLRSRVADARRRLGRVDGELEGVQQRLGRADALITASADEMAKLDAAMAALRREREVLEERRGGVEEIVRQARDAIAAIPPDGPEPGDLPPRPDPPVSLRVEVEALRRDRARLEAGLARLRAEMDELSTVEPGELRRDSRAAREAQEAAEATLSEAERLAADAGERRGSAGRDAASAREAEAAANEAWREAAAALQRLRDEHEDDDQGRRDLERRIQEAERVLREGHESDPEQALAELSDGDTPESIQRRADVVARRLGLLGRVNLVAAEEYRALGERHDFLKREIDDVKAARRDLQEVIREVDRKVVEIFDAAFADVAAEFASIVASLFPGGEGRLTLSDPSDLLRTGVEIHARPGRKRVRRISLLSGGERSLVALAFLFAIFRSRPSPFYLLDEVEAALDDINLSRFIELVRELAKTSQVLLVTHQKRTMEAADVLYGVSMDGTGTSTVISQRIPEVVAGLAASGG